ncbi:ubiquinol-cytochrome C reductase [Apiospora marii]|uniref:Complex III subunit 9 n=1 Tax=Apiospora marii TaxID=335849 RepID=A0ABR1S7K7_9PEZI
MVKPIYNALFARNWQMLGTVFAAGFGFELIYNQGTDKVWDSMNRGVSDIPAPQSNFRIDPADSSQRQWKDIRHKYVQEAEDE